MNWYFQALANYFNFADRARRKEYWMFVLFNMIFMIAVGVIDGVLGSFGILYGLGVFIPGLAVTVRRLHDTGRSGWWMLISIIPILGIILLTYFMVLDGHTGVNEYGVNPKTPDA